MKRLKKLQLKIKKTPNFRCFLFKKKIDFNLSYKESSSSFKFFKFKVNLSSKELINFKLP